MSSYEPSTSLFRDSDPIRRYAEELIAEPWPGVGVDADSPLVALRTCPPEERRRALRDLPLEEIEALVVHHWIWRSEVIAGVTGGAR